MKAKFVLPGAVLLAAVFLQASLFAADNVSVRGRIVDEDGKPLEGVAVRLNETDVETEADGVYSAEVPAGPVFLVFRDLYPKGMESWMTYRPQTTPKFLMPKAGEKVDLGDTTYFRAGAIIEGRAMMDTGFPAVNARIYIVTDEGCFIGRTDIRAGGEYRMELPLARQRESGYSMRVMFHEPSTLKDYIEIGKLDVWKTNRVDLKIASRFRNLYGKLAIEGRSAEGVRAVLYKAGQRSPLTYFPIARAGEDGVFVFRDVPFGSYVIRGCSSKTGHFSAEASNPCDTVQIFIAARATGDVEGCLEVLVDGKLAGEPDPESEKKGTYYGVFLADSEGKLLLPLLPAAIARHDPGKQTFRIEGLSPGKRFFHLRPCQKVDDFRKVEDMSEVQMMLAGPMFTHEGFYLVNMQPPPEEFFRGYGAEIVPGATARADKKVEYTMEQALKLLSK